MHNHSKTAWWHALDINLGYTCDFRWRICSTVSYRRCKTEGPHPAPVQRLQSRLLIIVSTVQSSPPSPRPRTGLELSVLPCTFQAFSPFQSSSPQSTVQSFSWFIISKVTSQQFLQGLIKLDRDWKTEDWKSPNYSASFKRPKSLKTQALKNQGPVELVLCT